jgi:E2F/DP family winged-helix DNA-binding domain
MRKRKQPETTIKEEEHIKEEWEEEELSANRRVRHDNSLSVLTKKFIELIRNSPDGTIDLNRAVEVLGVQKRRIYDITNVLEGINYVEKLQKNTIRWIGAAEDPSQEKEIAETRRRLDEMEEEEAEID